MSTARGFFNKGVRWRWMDRVVSGRKGMGEGGLFINGDGRDVG